MVDARIERLVVSAVRVGVFDGAGDRTERNLCFDSKRLTEGVLADESKLDRIKVLVVKVRRLKGHFAAIGRVATARLVPHVNRRARDGCPETDGAFVERAFTATSDRERRIAASGAGVCTRCCDGLSCRGSQRHCQPPPAHRLASASARSISCSLAPAMAATFRPFLSKMIK